MASDEEDIDIEINDYENCEAENILSRLPPFPDEYVDEIIGKELFDKCFQRRYNACPSFYPGFLQEACQTAFDSLIIDERRPVLVYIHNDNSLFTDVFCANVLCSEKVIDYLLDNYFLWPWDVTLNINKKTLENIWKDIFPTNSFMFLLSDEYPLLIGITRSFVGEIEGPLRSEYKFEIIFRKGKLCHVEDGQPRDALLKELKTFKEECIANERTLSTYNNFKTLFDLVPNSLDEIMKYVYLNDIINAFTLNILSEICKKRINVHLYQPNAEFIEKILGKLQPTQIVSLYINNLSMYSEDELVCFTSYTRLTSLTLLNDQTQYYDRNMKMYFPNLLRLSFCYDYPICPRKLYDVWHYTLSNITRLEIRCPDLFYNNTFVPYYEQNYSIQYLLLDVSHYPFVSTNEYSQGDSRCFLEIIIDFIKAVTDIRYLQIITHRDNVENLRNIVLWTDTMRLCSQLKKITVFASADLGHNDKQKAWQIERSQITFFSEEESTSLQSVSSENDY
ncbi:unnamed protein product [Adineta ricciae]|uniref:UAS domain-containing protein n=1 Tax=Adineta ricciae TaxID=249248 RepID=A0A815VWW9_ADIRI|nr:unnamed protein product [Adineta ricciae]CAF1541695.1 unnamed protein product [Adineta ricciae]